MLSRRRFLGLSAAAATVGSLGYAVESNVASVSDIELPLAGLKRPLKVLFISDMHMPRCFVSDATILAAAKEFDPDLVAIGGDSIDRRGQEKRVDWFEVLPARLGKFAIFGNWEHWGDCRLDVLKQEYDAAGVRTLVNEQVVVPLDDGSKLRLVGLDDLLGGKPQLELVQSAERGDDSQATVVLAHCPALFDRIELPGALCLSGHTHGGQISPLGIVLHLPRGSGNYAMGHYPGTDGRQLYVTRGLGNNGAPLRIGARPEIVRMTLLPIKDRQREQTTEAQRHRGTKAEKAG